MVDVKLAQKVNAFFEAETAYGDPVGSNLYHIGRLDTFDPRMLDHQYAGVPTIGHSTDAHVIKGPTKVTLPLKIGLWNDSNTNLGSGWRTLLGQAIGLTTIDSASRPAFLTTAVDSSTIIAEEAVGSNWQTTLVSGVSFNGATLEADFTAAAPMTLDFDALAYYTVEGVADSSRTTARNFATQFVRQDYSSASLPSQPTSDPLLAQDLTIEYSTAAATNGLTIDGPAGSYVEVGEKYMLFYTSAGALDSGVPSGDDAAIVANGVLDMTHANANTTQELDDLADSGWTGWTVTIAGSSTTSQNLVKGVYDTAAAKAIYAATTMTEWPYVKTASLKIANNNVPIAGKKTGDDGAVKVLANGDVARGKTDITLDITATAKDETFYDLMQAETLLPLVRLTINDGGTNRTIALTNGRIVTRTAGYTAGGEVTETISIKFVGDGDYHNWSKYAISGDF